MAFAFTALGLNTVLKPLVSGGTLTSDSTYFYRTFTSSSTLTTSYAPLSGQILLVGGGSGANATWGGGGGGVFNEDIAIPANSTSTIVVGAGGGIGANGSSTTWTMPSYYNSAGGGLAIGTGTMPGRSGGPQNNVKGDSVSFTHSPYGCNPYACNCGLCYDWWSDSWYSCNCQTCYQNCYNTSTAYGGGGGAGGVGQGPQGVVQNAPDLTTGSGSGAAGGAGLTIFGSTYGQGGSRVPSGGTPTNGAANTGNAGQSRGATGGTGGSGIAIIRYLKTAVA